MCVHVFLCIRVHLSLSLCVCLCLLPPPSWPWFLRKLRCWQSAGWLAGHLLFTFIIIFFLIENTQARGATAYTKATPLGCIKMNRVLFNNESRELLYICKLAWVWVFSSFSFDLAVEWSTAKSKNLGEQEVPLGAAVCLFLFFKMRGH